MIMKSMQVQCNAIAKSDSEGKLLVALDIFLESGVQCSESRFQLFLALRNY